MAARLPTPRPILDAKTVLDYVFLAQFDLLRDSRHQVQEYPWSRPAERLAMNTWFKIQRSQEELPRLSVEAFRLNTWIHDDEALLDTTLQMLDEKDPLLAHQVQKLRKYKGLVNKTHKAIIQQMQASQWWVSWQGVGVHQGMTPAPGDEPTGPVSGALGGPQEVDEDVLGEDDLPHAPGSMYIVWKALGDDSQTMEQYTDL